MYQIDLRHVQTAGAGLSAQRAALNGIAEELCRIEAGLKEMSFAEEACVLLGEIRKELNEECAVFHQMASCLEEIEQVYRTTERSVADRYDLEYVSYPKTAFGVSRITGLEKYESLLAFGNSGRRT